jgi:hypothetical protein
MGAIHWVVEWMVCIELIVRPEVNLSEEEIVFYLVNFSCILTTSTVPIVKQ